MRPVVLLFALLFSASLPAAVVPMPPDADEPAEDAKAWVEEAVNLPPYPKTSSLVEFSVSAASSNRFFIDADTLSIGKDGVVRYALVVRSATGAENVSFEGIRCATREQKFFAFGQRDGTWARARNAQWRLIEYKDINRQHAVLHTDIFCASGKNPPRAVREIVQLLRYGPR